MSKMTIFTFVLLLLTSIITTIYMTLTPLNIIFVSLSILISLSGLVYAFVSRKQKRE